MPKHVVFVLDTSGRYVLEGVLEFFPHEFSVNVKAFPRQHWDAIGCSENGQSIALMYTCIVMRKSLLVMFRSGMGCSFSLL